MRLLTSALLAATVSASPAFAQDAAGADGGPSPTEHRPIIEMAPAPTLQPYSPQMSAAPPSRTPLDRQDEVFLHEIAAAGMTEAEFGRLAQKNAASAAVKDYGKRMVEDHTMANDRLEVLVKTSEIKLPTTMNGAYQKSYSDLKKLKGAAFDRAFVKAQLDDHKKVVQMLEHQASAGKDPQLKAFAAETLPTAKHHLEMAQSLQTRVQTSQR